MGREREGRREYVWIGELRVVAASETVSSRAERERGEREGRRRKKKKRKVQPCPREREQRRWGGWPRRGLISLALRCVALRARVARARPRWDARGPCGRRTDGGEGGGKAENGRRKCGRGCGDEVKEEASVRPRCGPCVLFSLPVCVRRLLAADRARCCSLQAKKKVGRSGWASRAFGFGRLRRVVF